MNPVTPPRGHALRLGRHSQPGQVYLVTTVTQGRTPCFLDFRLARSVIQVLAQTQERERAQTLAYVLMPDHLHWLLSLGPRDDLSRLVRDLKAIAAHRIGRPLWQKGFHDRALRSEESVIDVARYVIQIRCGQVLPSVSETTRTGMPYGCLERDRPGTGLLQLRGRGALRWRGIAQGLGSYMPAPYV